MQSLPQERPDPISVLHMDFGDHDDWRPQDAHEMRRGAGKCRGVEADNR